MARGTKIRTGSVQVEGLRELSRALNEIGPDLKKMLAKTNKDVAEKEATHARSAAGGMGGVAAKTAPSIGAVGGIGSAGVAFGGAAYPFAMGAAFGGQGRPTTMQFKPHLGKVGYFPYPQIRDDLDDIEDTYSEALEKLLSIAFPH